MKFGGVILASAIGVAILAASAGTVVAIADIPAQESGVVGDVAPITTNAIGATPSSTPAPSLSPQDVRPGTVMVTPPAPPETGKGKGNGGHDESDG
jgi:hypothetical protein